MPGIITHYLCGEAIIGETEEPIKRIINKNRQYYNVGTQGPDIFFYYLPMLIKKGFGNLGIKMHNSNFSLFIGTLIDKTESLSEPVRSAFFAYLSGFLSHYALDCAAHPYIYYRSGFRSNYFNKIKYSVYHRRFETAIDVLMLKLVNSERPSDKRLWELIRIGKDDALCISGLLSDAIRGSYDVPIKSIHVYKAMAYMAYTTKFLQSSKGRRKKFIEIAENLTVREQIVSSLIHMQEMTDGIDFLNTKKGPWHKPWDNTQVLNSSFTDLFEKAVIEASEMIRCLHEFMNNNLSKERLLSVIGNNSLSSGVDCGQEVEFMYSDIVFEGGA